MPEMISLYKHKSTFCRQTGSLPHKWLLWGATHHERPVPAAATWHYAGAMKCLQAHDFLGGAQLH